MLTINDVARKLGISTARVRELVLGGELTAFQQDGELHFTQEGLNTYILALLSAIDDDDEDPDAEDIG